METVPDRDGGAHSPITAFKRPLVPDTKREPATYLITGIKCYSREVERLNRLSIRTIGIHDNDKVSEYGNLLVHT